MTDCKKTPDGRFTGFTVFYFKDSCEDCQDGAWSGHTTVGEGPLQFVAERTSTYRKSDCGEGFRGGSVQYKVRAVSEKSQEDADIRAMGLVSDRAAAQSYANSIGDCYPVETEPIEEKPIPRKRPTHPYSTAGWRQTR